MCGILVGAGTNSTHEDGYMSKREGKGMAKIISDSRRDKAFGESKMYVNDLWTLGNP